MISRQRLISCVWVLVLIGALGWLGWINHVRFQRIAYVSSQPNWSLDAPAVDLASPTGYAREVRQMLVPERNSESQQWVMQTQQMFASQKWRVRHVDYDNAPAGRETRLPCLYRWWLGGLAWIDHILSYESLAQGVTRASLYADPLLLALVLIGTSFFVARSFGAVPATLFSIGLVSLFPLGGQFLPGAPDHRSMVAVFALWSVMPLLVGLNNFGRWLESSNARGQTHAQIASPASRWFFAAGVVGGLSLWLSPATQLPLLGGIGLSALIMAWLIRDQLPAREFFLGRPELWRSWALGGSTIVLLAYFVEYWPEVNDNRLETIHPLYGLAWLGGGELLPLLVGWILGNKINRSFRSLVFPLLSVVVISWVGWLALSTRAWAADPFASRLTNLSNAPVLPNLAAWLTQDGISQTLLATLAPSLLVVVAFIFLCRRNTETTHRISIAMAFGPVVVALVMACFQLRWWNSFDSVLLALLVAVAGVRGKTKVRAAKMVGPVFILLLLIPGFIRLLPFNSSGQNGELNETEVRSLIDRDLAQWLTAHSSVNNPVVLAAPELTSALCFYGHLRGVGTVSPENFDGVTAAIRIASATSFDEAEALINQRQIAYIVIPSWDLFLDQYARIGSNRPDRVFIAALRRWNLPLWLRPVVYYLPKIPGYEGQSVVVFRVVDEQDEVVALGNQAEYFIETGQLDLAAACEEKLTRYPVDPGALSACAQVELARGDRAAFASTLGKLIPYSTQGGDRDMEWDRRMSLAVVLVQGRRIDLARGVIRRCVAETDEARLRSLSANSLLRLLALRKLASCEFTDPHLTSLALELLPPNFRQRL